MPFTACDGLAGFGKETSWGEAAGASLFAEVVSENIVSSNSLSSPDGAAGTRLRKRLMRGVRRLEGDLEVLPTPEVLGFGLLLMFGEPVTTELDTGVYQHVFAGEAAEAVSASVEVNLGGFRSRQLTGCKAESLRLAFPQRDVLHSRLGLVGKQESLINPSSFELAGSEPLSFVGGSAEFPVGTPCADLSGGEIVWFRELVRDWATLGSGLEIAKLPEGRRSTSLRLNLDFEDESAYQAFLQAEWRSLKLHFEGEEITPGHQAMLEVEIGKFRIDSPGLHIASAGSLLVHDLSCEAVVDTTQSVPSDAQITLVNSVAAY